MRQLGGSGDGRRSRRAARRGQGIRRGDLAVGFGIEGLPFDLPWNSYWRVDPLDQTLLDEDIAQPSVVIVGSGDGALIRRPPELRPDLR